jgi:CheY-like chemotaxis protein
VLVAMVQALGLQPDARADGIEALRKIDDAEAGAEPYDLVCWTGRCPAWTASTARRCIRELARPGARSPTVLMLTAFSRDEVLKRVRRAGRADRRAADQARHAIVPVRCLLQGARPGLAGRRARRAAQRSPSDHPFEAEGARILLVEDNAINREVALELLTGGHHRRETAAEGREALQILERERFDAVLMDCQMPVMDASRPRVPLRERPALRVLPVIAMTANAMVGDRERALAAGMNDHIAKPIVIDEMFATLAKWLAPRTTGRRPPRPAHADLAFAAGRGRERRAGAHALQRSAAGQNAAAFPRCEPRLRGALRLDPGHKATRPRRGAWRTTCSRSRARSACTDCGKPSRPLEQACCAATPRRSTRACDKVSVLIEPILQGVQSWADARARTRQRPLETGPTCRST